MLTRLIQIEAGQLTPDLADLRFYTHELREFERYVNVGYPIGQPADESLAYQLWSNAHAATLADYGLPEIDELGNRLLYHQSFQYLFK